MGMQPGVATPPVAPGIRAQQGMMGAPPQAQPTDQPAALIIKIGELMRRLAQMLQQTNPNSLQTLKGAVPIFAQLLSEVQPGSQGQGQPPTPAPTPSEVPPPPSQSAAPGAGYTPGM